MANRSGRNQQITQARDARKRARNSVGVGACMADGTSIGSVYKPLSDSDVKRIHSAALGLTFVLVVLL